MNLFPATIAFPPPLADQLRQSACRIVVTGGSGWIAQAALEMLDSTFGDDLPDRVAVFGSSDRTLSLRSGRAMPCRALKHIAALDAAPAFFIHTAFLTRDKLQDKSVADFTAANQAITDMVSDAMEKTETRGLLTFSSGAVYKKGTRRLDEDLETNAYGAMKIADEKRFTDLARQKNVPLCMPRLFNLSGPFINKIDTYALACFIRAALDNQPIAIRAAHRVLRSYVHVADLLTLGLTMLLNPLPGDPPVFDTEGKETLEMTELAERVRATLGRDNLPIDRPPLTEAPDDIYVGDGRVMRGLLQAHGLQLRDIGTQISDTAAYLRTILPLATERRAHG